MSMCSYLNNSGKKRHLQHVFCSNLTVSSIQQPNYVYPGISNTFRFKLHKPFRITTIPSKGDSTISTLPTTHFSSIASNTVDEKIYRWILQSRVTLREKASCASITVVNACIRTPSASAVRIRTYLSHPTETRF